jgi:hypothetical protein
MNRAGFGKDTWSTICLFFITWSGRKFHLSGTRENNFCREAAALNAVTVFLPPAHLPGGKTHLRFF